MIRDRRPPSAAGASNEATGAGAAFGEGGASGETRGTGGSGGTSGTATAGDAGADGGGDLRSSVALEGMPFYTRAQRLTNSQWEHAVTDILRLDAPPHLAQSFEAPVAGVTDFTNNERLLSVTSTLAQSYQSAAEAAAALATGTDGALAALYPGTDTSGFVATLGRRAFRRPLTANEQQRYEGVFARGQELYGATFAAGASLVIRAMLQSPYFLYRTELGPSGEPLDDYEVASKLSFWLRDTTPSDDLLDQAAAGELSSADALEVLARTMLEEPSAVAVMRDFHGQLMHLDRLSSLVKPSVPEFSEAIDSELLDASYLFFDHVFTEGLGLREILTSPVGYVGAGMAAFYGMPPPAQGLEARDLGPERLGYFMQLPFLMVNGINRDPDSIHRGVELNLDVLCADVGTPASNLPPLPPQGPGQTNRQRIEALTGTCGAACHGVLLDPLGFAFEDFDGMGQQRTSDNGEPIDTTGSYPFAEGVKSFSGASELVQILADSPQAHTCYAKKLASYALQRDVVASDQPLLDELSQVSGDGSLKELVVALVREPAFRTHEEATP